MKYPKVLESNKIIIYYFYYYITIFSSVLSVMYFSRHTWSERKRLPILERTQITQNHCIINCVGVSN